MLAIVVFSIFVPFITHVVITRVAGLFTKPFARQKGIIVAFLVGFIPVDIMFCVWANSLKTGFQPGMLWSGLYLYIIYTLAGYVYFHIFNMSETARRIKILSEIAKTGQFNKEDLSKDYTAREIVLNRLKRLIALGELRFIEDKYYIGRGTFVLLARMVFSLRNILFPSR